MRVVFFSSTLLLLLLSATHLSAQRPSVCLALRLTGADNTPVAWASVHLPPDTVAIDSATFFARNGASFVIRSGADTHRRSGRGQAVRDSLFLSWFNSQAGVALRGSVQDSTYRGQATILADAVTPSPASGVRVLGVRVPCPAGLSR